jgi:cupin fold WbuC family metalloprotein
MPHDVQLIDAALIEATIERALASPRRRANHNLHAGPADNPHRFLNVFVRGSYVTPHRHLEPPKSETFLVLEGELAAFTFDDDGRITHCYHLGAPGTGTRGIDFPAGVWHTVAALSELAVCLEVKPGPWDPATDKEFARWAPPEGDPAAAQYLEGLLRSRRK